MLYFAPAIWHSRNSIDVSLMASQGPGGQSKWTSLWDSVAAQELWAWAKGLCFWLKSFQVQASKNNIKVLSNYIHLAINIVLRFWNFWIFTVFLCTPSPSRGPRCTVARHGFFLGKGHPRPIVEMWSLSKSTYRRLSIATWRLVLEGTTLSLILVIKEINNHCISISCARKRKRVGNMGGRCIEFPIKVSYWVRPFLGSLNRE